MDKFNNERILKGIVNNPEIKDLWQQTGYYIYRLYYTKNDSNKKEITLDINILKGNIFLAEKESFFNKGLLLGPTINSYTNERVNFNNIHIDILKFAKNEEEAYSITKYLRSYFREIKHELNSILWCFFNSKLPTLHIDSNIIKELLDSNSDVYEIITTYKLLNESCLNKNFKETVDSLNTFLDENNIDYKIINSNNRYLASTYPRNKSINRYDEMLNYITNCRTKDIKFNNFYVYRHYYIDKETNKEVTFYIGKGFKQRAISTNRTEKWLFKANQLLKSGIDIKIDIVRFFSSEEEALNLEKVLISYFASIGECECNVFSKNIDKEEYNNIIHKLELKQTHNKKSKD